MTARQPGVRTGLLILIDQASLSAGNFLTGLLLGRICTPAEFGAYTLVFAAINGVSGIQNALIVTPLTVFAPSREGEPLRAYLGGSLANQALLSLLLSAAGLITAAALAVFRPDSPWLGAFLGASAAVFFEQLQEFYRRVLLARFRPGGACLVDLAGAALRLSLLAALVFISSLSEAGTLVTARNAFLCIAAASAVAAGIGAIRIRDWIAHPAGHALRAARDNWTFGRWALASAGVVAVSMQVYPWALATLHGARAVAVLGACQALVFVSNPVMNALGNFYGPYLAKSASGGSAEGLAGSVRQYLLATACFVGGVLLLLVLARDPLLASVYSGKYDGHGALVVLLASATTLHAFGRPLAAALNAIHRPDLLFRTHVIALVVSTAIAWPLIRAHGPAGVAIGHIVTNVCLLAVRGTVLLRVAAPARAPGAPAPPASPGSETS